jgi:hypothetical protein
VVELLENGSDFRRNFVGSKSTSTPPVERAVTLARLNAWKREQESHLLVDPGVLDGRLPDGLVFFS